MTAWKRGKDHDTAMAIMADAQRKFLTCDNVKLEVLPNPIYENRQAEVDFYNEHFSSATNERFSPELGDAALALANKYGLAAGDALNLASALRQGADEFITSELPGQPMFRVQGIKIISLRQLAVGV